MSVLPDAADEHEHLFGTRRQGLYSAGWSFASKAASGGGLLIAGVVLQLIHFPADASATAGGAIPATTADWLGLAGGPGAALLALLGTVVMLFYRVDRRAHARITADLIARRGAQVDGGANNRLER
jgi:GPH family glycoside/pentoside/hexuronide:cation symporter